MVFEVLCALLIALFGFGSASANDESWYHLLLPATQLPAILALSSVGLCCGFGNGLLISDLISNRWGGLTAVGAPVIFVVNLGLLTGLLAAAHYWRARARRASGMERGAPAI